MGDADESRRRSIRLDGYDYSQGGCYYFTVCTQDRIHRFGEIADSAMSLNAAGHMVVTVWESLPARFPSLELDSFIVMPDHLHGILWLCPSEAADLTVTVSLAAVVGAFKSLVTTDYMLGVRAGRLKPFGGKLLQRNYYEHIVRSDESLELIREYILTNPTRWGQRPDASSAAGEV